MLRTRLLIGLLGVVVGVYGAYLWLSRQEGPQITSAAKWLVAGPILHDLVLSMAVILVVAVASRVVPDPARAPLAVGAIVLGSVSLIAVPMLGRYGEKPDNPTLLDRDYTTGWLVVAGLVLLGVLVATVVRARRSSGSSSDTP